MTRRLNYVLGLHFVPIYREGTFKRRGERGGSVVERRTPEREVGG